jgi:hypothetical protein
MEPVLKSLSVEDLKALKELIAQIIEEGEKTYSPLGLSEDSEKAKVLNRIAHQIRTNAQNRTSESPKA